MLRNTDDAFDLAQDVYLKAFAQIDKFDGRSAIATWLYRIAVNEALQFLRRVNIARERLQQMGVAATVEPHGNGADARLDVEGSLATVAPTDRALLLLRYQEGLDYRSIADALGCAEGTVASRLNRARERLRVLLKGGYGNREGTTSPMHPKGSG